MLEYLEIDLRNRVDAKLGRYEHAGRLDLPVYHATNATAGAYSPVRSRVAKSRSPSRALAALSDGRGTALGRATWGPSPRSSPRALFATPSAREAALRALRRGPGGSSSRVATLRRVFAFYARADEDDDAAWTTAVSRPSRVARASRPTVSEPEWFRFARDFNLIRATNRSDRARVESGALARRDVADAFQDARLGDDDDDDVAETLSTAASTRTKNRFEHFGDSSSPERHRPRRVLTFEGFERALLSCAARDARDFDAREPPLERSVGRRPDVPSAVFSPPSVARDRFGRLAAEDPAEDKSSAPVTSNGSGSPRSPRKGGSPGGSRGARANARPRFDFGLGQPAYPYKERLFPGAPNPRAYDRTLPTQYCPAAGLPAHYHSAMVDMVSRRELEDERAELARKRAVVAGRAEALARKHARAEARREGQRRAGQRADGAFAGGAFAGARRAADGRVAVGFAPTPRADPRDVLRSTQGAFFLRATEGDEGDEEEQREEGEEGGLSEGRGGDWPDVHACYRHGTRMRNVLTIRRGDGGRMVPCNRMGALRMAGVDGVSKCSAGLRNARFPGLGFPSTPREL